MKQLWLFLMIAATLPAADLRPYCWGFLNTYEGRSEISEARTREIQEGHMAHMTRMADAGRLVAAGPLATPGGARGLLVYKCDSVEQAVEWTDLDPAVVNKRLRVEIYRWNGAGLWGEPLATKLKTDSAYKYEMVRLPFAVIMKTGTTAPGAPPRELEAAHLAYASELVRQGKLRSFGLFENAPDQVAEKLGVFIYAAMDIEEARKLAADDPLVKGGWGTPVMHVWYVADEAVPVGGKAVE